jgi:hypothetical protein
MTAYRSRSRHFGKPEIEKPERQIGIRLAALRAADVDAAVARRPPRQIVDTPSFLRRQPKSVSHRPKYGTARKKKAGKAFSSLFRPSFGSFT